MSLSSRVRAFLAPKVTAKAHCDLPCGIYDPEQARIEAESCYKIIEKMGANTGETVTLFLTVKKASSTKDRLVIDGATRADGRIVKL